MVIPTKERFVKLFQSLCPGKVEITWPPWPFGGILVILQSYVSGAQ
jgi:hypothetical protein